ncbi:unannotated protein [freshwater metagenome]|uniref:Unannotated protein n=1 Tax=freshwater metagenome TaxID=449393 RepID=A0A6J6EPZ0_9ZZZZ
MTSTRRTAFSGTAMASSAGCTTSTSARPADHHDSTAVVLVAVV